MIDTEPTNLVTRKGDRLHIELNRPHRLNAFTVDAIHALSQVIDETAEDSSVRLVTLQGAGKAFSTGVDLKEFPSDGMGTDRIEAWEGMLRRIETMDKLVLCLIHGYAVGGGLQLALACDIRVCTAAAKLGLPASKEGIIPGLSTYRLARYVGLGRAKQLIYLGNLITGDEAHRIGLVDHLVDDANANVEFDALVDSYDAAFSAGGKHAKPLLADCFHSDFSTFLDFYCRQQAKAVGSSDFTEAQAAYKEGRDARWS
jgi:enoyl-CoA hydratase/carnithine racemase